MKLPLALVVAGAIVTSVVVLFALSLKEHERHVTMIQQSHLADVGALISTHLDTSIQEGQNIHSRANAELLALQSHKDLISAYVIDAQKNEFAAVNFKPQLAAQINKQTVFQLATGGHYVQGKLVDVRSIGNSSSPIGRVILVSDISTLVAENYKSMLWHGSPVVLAIAGIAIFLAVWMVTVLLKPLQSLSKFTQEIAETKNYATRFPISHQNEIARIGTNINSFLDTIEVELTINQEQNDTLVEQQQTMMRLANYDSLTGLPNRQFVVDNLRLELARVRRTQGDLALIFFDLDGFKGINDSLGHETGDLILIEVADRVVTLLREGDLVARLGGDEFIIVPDREVSVPSLNNLAERLVQAFTEPFMLRGLALKVGVSVGIAKASDAGYELSQLMSNADLAMYRSKAKGRGTYTLFTVDMVESYKRKMSIANSIDSAIRNDEFLVYYQPKVGQAGDIVGLEALIRWKHPEFGLVMPGEFIPVAEQGGKISVITQWMLERVCMELPDLQMMIDHKFKVAVNLSGHDLRHSGLFDDIYELFDRYQVNPDYFEFEVTESAYLENFAIADKFFKRLSNLGCSIALDDFGTGYSSLSYLTRITIDTLKIDRQFIRELETSERSRLVTGTIIDLAKRLSLTVCAEGIEKSSQWHYLINHGCDHVQGFLFSKPVPLGELLNMPLNYSHFLCKAPVTAE